MEEVNRLLGIDWGEKRIGLSMSDPMNKYAIPYKVLKNNTQFYNQIIEIIKEYKISIVIVGLPLKMDGSDSFISKRIKKFIIKLKNTFKNNNINVKIETISERFTTNDTYSLMDNYNISKKKLKEIKDAISASLILENYLLQKYRREV